MALHARPPPGGELPLPFPPFFPFCMIHNPLGLHFIFSYKCQGPAVVRKEVEDGEKGAGGEERPLEAQKRQ